MYGSPYALAAGADFSIKGLYKYELFGQELWITTTHVSLFLITIILLGFMIAVNRAMKKATDVPKGLQNVAELIVELVDNLVYGVMGDNYKRFRNYIGVLFMFLLFANLSGLLGLRPPTADYGVTLPLGLITFVMINYCGIKHNKLGHFTGLFEPMPLMFPVNFIGEIAIPISLSLRLFGNIMSGTVMVGLVYGLLPIWVKLGIPSVLHFYFDIFSGAIQAYVFCMLTMVNVNGKISDE